MGGQFLSLGMWEKQGADTRLIEQNTPPCDVRWNNQLGWTYRVIIESETKKRRLTQIEAMDMAGRKRRRGQTKAIKDSVKKTKKSSSSGSSSDSSSDSSSSGGGQGPQEAQEPQEAQVVQESEAERKAREKKEAAEAKAAASKAAAKATALAKAHAKAQNQTRAKAEKIKPKVTATLNGLRAAVGHHLIFEIPESISAPVRQLILVFERLLAALDGVLQENAEEWPSCLDGIPFADAKKAEQLLLAMIKGLAAAKGIKLKQ